MSATRGRRRGDGATSQRPRVGRGVASLLGGGALLARRRARRDLPLVVVATALTAMAGFVALAAPALITRTLDGGASEAVARAGGRADLLATADVAAPRTSWTETVLKPDEIIDIATGLPSVLPPALQTAAGPSTLSVLGPETTATIPAQDREDTEGKRVVASVAMITDSVRESLQVEDGEVPDSANADEPYQVAVSTDTAEQTGLSVGSEIAVTPSAAGRADPIRLVVAAIVSVAAADSGTDNDTEPAGSPFQDLPTFLVPDPRVGRNVETVAFTVLTTPENVLALSDSYDTPFRATIRLRLDPSAVTAGRLARISEEYSDLAANSSELTPTGPTVLTVRSSIPDVADRYVPAARAASAQLWTSVTGLLLVAAAVLVMLAGLLVDRRAADLRLARARGASVPAVTLQAFIGSLISTAAAAVLAGAAGFGVPALLDLPLALDAGFGVAAAILLFALLAVPATTALRLRDGVARRPANARERRVLARTRGVRRVTAELAVVALAAAAVAALIVRGPASSGSDQVDPLLAAAPLLLAAVVTIVVLRLQPIPVAVASRAGARSTGLAGAVAVGTVRRPLHAIPLLALTLATALAVSGALLAATVDAGQEAASWRTVGADARADAPVTAAQVEQVRSAPGVTGAAALTAVTGVQLDLGTTLAAATVFAFDDDYLDILDHVSGAVPTAETRAAIAGLLGTAAGDALPALVDEDLGDRLVKDDLFLRFTDEGVTPLAVAGPIALQPPGFSSTGYVFIDSDALYAQVPDSAAPNVLLATGPGAAAAVEALDLDPSTVLTRDGWLEEQRGSALVAGVRSTIALSALVLALLGLATLAATALAGARERTRTLTLLRTLGAPTRIGGWITFAELAPLVVAATVGGTIAGVAVVGLLSPAMDLGRLTGGGAAPPVFPVLVFAAVAAAAVGAVVIGVIGEQIIGRRSRLSEVLRVGETI